MFKTPTMFKTSSRANHEQAKVQPRKLTAEFDNAKSPVDRRNTPTNQNFKTSNVPQKDSSCSKHSDFAGKASNRSGTSVPAGTSKPVTTTDDDDFISDDDEEIFRQADLIYASQSSQDSKVFDSSKIKLPPQNQNRQSSFNRPHTSLSNACELGSSKSKISCPSTSTKIIVDKTYKIKENNMNKNNSEDGFSNDDFSDDSFDDLEIDEALLERINAQNAKQKGMPNIKILNLFNLDYKSTSKAITLTKKYQYHSSYLVKNSFSQSEVSKFA